jgi:transcriptional regulator with XRE-family HTH domain
VAADPLVVFASNLRRLREAAGLSQDELGLRAGVGVSNVSRYESAKRDPSVRTVARLADALGVDPAQLLEGVGRSRLST